MKGRDLIAVVVVVGGRVDIVGSSFVVNDLDAAPDIENASPGIEEEG